MEKMCLRGVPKTRNISRRLLQSWQEVERVCLLRLWKVLSKPRSQEQALTEPILPSETKPSIKSCLVISPIGDRLAPFESEERLRYEQAIEVWDYVIKPACEALEIDPVRVDKIDEPGEITEQTFERLRDGDLVIADLTGGNANVMYELGLRHTKNKLTIQIGEKERLPFDVTTIRTIQFVRSESGLVEAREALKRAIVAGVERGPRPVTATRIWLGEAALAVASDEVADEQSESLEEHDEGPGFLDMLVETEEALPLLVQVSEELTTVFNELPALTDQAVREIATSDERGGGAAGRLVVAQKLSMSLEEPTVRIEQMAANFVDQLGRMDPGISYQISFMEEDPSLLETDENARTFATAIAELARASEQSLGQVAMLANSVQDLGKISNRLRPVTRRMSTAVRKISGGFQTIKKWGDHVESVS